MSARLLSSRLAPVARRLPSSTLPQSRHLASTSRPTAGGLLRRDVGARLNKRRAWPPGAYSVHNLPAVRTIFGAAFVRVIPKFFGRLLTLGAISGGAVVAGFTYIQGQATAAGGYALDIFKTTSNTVSTAAGSIYGGASGILEQTRRGWDKTVGEAEVPAWLQNILGKGESGSDGGSGPEGEPKQSSTGAAAAAVAGSTGAAFGYDSQSEEDKRPEENIARDEQMMMLTKKMIEIRTLLQTVGQSDSLTLPSIVVIGSQSSGKSSVLEAIVGHEFLPKGSNMVTRRPIELTLINTPEAKAEYGEFPALGLGKITDFSQIQKTLTDLNLAVPAEQCVTDDPIQLRIHSPNVPDLSLIDLPGYIQVVGKDQPGELRERIAELCEKYIQPPNVILAVSAADVDLANSTALRAARKVDPRGERTIGVITKMDLVTPDRGAAMLSDKMYALRLGYIGVVAKIPQTQGGLFNRGSGNITAALVRNENSFFGTHADTFGEESQLEVGTTNLRKKLMYVLENTMAASLKTTSEAISRELAETTYEFKVQYNERPLNAETYMAEALDNFKHSFKAFCDSFGREQARELLKHELDQQVLNLLAQRYWNKPIEDLAPPLPETDSLADLPKADPENPLWQLKLDSSSSALTKAGIGRLATAVVADALQAHIDHLVASSVFANHPFARQAINDASSSILKDLSYDISDELEICIKPYKYRIDVEDHEWQKGRENISNVLKEELRAVEGALKGLENEIGGKKKLKDVTSFIDRVRSGQIVLEGTVSAGAGGFSSALLSRGREAVFLRDRLDILRMRLMAVKSKQCRSPKNKYYCPEVFLDAVAAKLTTTADLFLDAELLSKFYYIFPRELDARLGRGLSPTEVDRFAREDPKIRRHIDVVRRKDLLERVLKEMEALRQIEAREKRYSSRATQTSHVERGQRRWGLF